MNKRSIRIRRYTKIRKKIHSTCNFRLVVHRSSKHIYAQIISYKTAMVLVCASTLEFKRLDIKNLYTGNKESAKFVGTWIAERALKYGIKKVSFDRSGFKYHGRLKELAESARKSGLIF
ncbi:50S ribosomal protein L18 [Buchnera aphidicola (Cinara strobi)]|uniref:Large ribosomal subunit protein uL18 n=1 Tax=Buchnera aphidicola (Cinara strobi) TaxID=1921549 RepID=A0A3B1DS46_9GAMM|nr:50S ribosomal protein L18 [Buchnera aphidicola]VAX76794.1 50S ribosomal protein L18 [Buchnera aphidicola (Cinara strobi)]